MLIEVRLCRVRRGAVEDGFGIRGKASSRHELFRVGGGFHGRGGYIVSLSPARRNFRSIKIKAYKAEIPKTP